MRHDVDCRDCGYYKVEYDTWSCTTKELCMAGCRVKTFDDPGHPWTYSFIDYSPCSAMHHRRWWWPFGPSCWTFDPHWSAEKVLCGYRYDRPWCGVWHRRRRPRMY